MQFGVFYAICSWVNIQQEKGYTLTTVMEYKLIDL